MRLTTIGTGTAAPAAQRVQSGYLVETDDTRVLLDCGSGVAFRMASLGIVWQEITHLAITHFHADHTADLATLMYAWRYGDLPPRSAPLELIGPPGTTDFVNRLAGVFGTTVRDPGFVVNVHELASDTSVELADVVISAVKVPHTNESIAISISHDSLRLVYSGDTGPDESLGVWAEGCDVLLAECSLPDALAIPTHLTPRQCGALAALAQPRQLVLTHFYPPVERVDIRAEVAEQFAGSVVLADDGMVLEIT